MSTYVKLRKKIQTKTQALTKIMAEASEKKKDLMYSQFFLATNLR